MMGFTAYAQNVREGEFLVQAPKEANLNEFHQQLIQTHTDVKLIDKRHKIFLVNRPSVELQAFGFQQVNDQAPSGSLVEPNMEFHIDALPNDPLLAQQMNLVGEIEGATRDCAGQRIRNVKSVGMENVYSSSPVLAKQAVVAVIDTGVSLSHPDLQNAIYINDAEANGTPGVDDDGNGYVDDVSGYDFFNDQPQGMDDNGHGTHVAGVIAASTDNSEGIASISDQTLILPLKFLGGNGSGSLAGALSAIEYAQSMNVDVINASFGGGGQSDIFQNVISDLYEDGVLFVAAAGNSGQDIDRRPTYPAAYEDVIAVSATRMDGSITRFSNYGDDTVMIAAPGENILSPVVEGYECLSGTSMAAPHVAGALALAKSVYPEESADQLVDRLLTSADQEPSLERFVDGGRFLRVDKMLE